MSTVMIVVLTAVLLAAVAIGVYLVLSNSHSENKNPVVKISQGSQNQVVEIKDHSVYIYYEPTPQEAGPVGVMSECNDPNIVMEDTSTMTEFLSSRDKDLDKEQFEQLLFDVVRSGILLYREDGTQVTAEDVIKSIHSRRMNRYPQAAEAIAKAESESAKSDNSTTSEEENFVAPQEDKEDQDRKIDSYEEEQIAKEMEAISEAQKRERERKNQDDIKTIQTAMKNLAAFSVPKDLN